MNRDRPWPFKPKHLTEFIRGDILSIIETGISHQENMPLSICEFQGNEPKEFGPLRQERSLFCAQYRGLSVKGNIKPGDIVCTYCEFYGMTREMMAKNERKIRDYWCHMGIMKLAAPITVDGRVVAVLFGGQIIYDHMKEVIIDNLNDMGNIKLSENCKKELQGHLEINVLKMIPKAEIDKLIQTIKKESVHTLKDLEDRKLIIENYAKIIGDQASNIHRELKRAKEEEFFHEVAMIFERRDCASIDEFRELLEEVLKLINSFCALKKTIFFVNYREDQKNILPVFLSYCLPREKQECNFHINLRRLKLSESSDLVGLPRENIKQYLKIIKQSLKTHDSSKEPEIDFETILCKANDKGISIALGIGPRADGISMEELINHERRFFMNLVLLLYSAVNNKLTSIQLKDKDTSLKSKFKELERAISDIAHEFKIHLQPIQTEADLWERICAKRHPQGLCISAVPQNYAQITSSIKSLAKFTEKQLNTYSRETVTAKDAPREYIDLPSLLLASVEQHKLKPVTFYIDDSVYLLPSYPIEKDEFTRAINNLVDNAVKYSFPHKEIRISARFPHNEYQIVISNFGYGVHEDEVSRVFERHYRGRAATGAKLRGQGIGLPDARDIIVSHGGRVTLESYSGKRDVTSTSGEGYVTTVTIVLPFHNKER